MLKSDNINGAHGKKTVYDLLMQILSDAGISALVATGGDGKIIQVNEAICSALNIKSNDLLADTAGNILRILFELGIDVQTQYTEENGVVYKVYSFKDQIEPRNFHGNGEINLEKEIQKNIFCSGVMESIPDAVVTVDLAGVTTGWNKEAVRLFGWAAEEAIGQPVGQLISAESGDDVLVPLRDAVDVKALHCFECAISGKDGVEKEVSASMVPIIIDGKKQGTVAVYADVSHRDAVITALRENEARFRAVTNSAQDAVMIINSDAEISFINAAAERMFGYSRAEALGKELHRIIAPEEYWDMFEMGFSQFRKSGQGMVIGRVMEMQAMRKDGSLFPVELSVSSFFLDGGWQATGIMRDVSERKKIELELIEAREEALNSTRTKSEFLANMSHEIRTPLNAIIGTNDLLWETNLTDIQKNYLRINRNASDNLLKLINDILDISKVEAGKVELESIPFNLYVEIGKTCETLALRVQEKGLELNCRIDPSTPEWVTGDSSRLKQVVINLIGNAIKFTEKGEILLDIKPMQQGRIGFTVKDTGIGIPEGKREAIFMSFTQADSSHSRRYGGTGLGLAICTRLVELMGGEISVESEVGSGSSFFFYIDLLQAEPLEIPDESLSFDMAGSHILVVDDNRTSRIIIKDIFESLGAAVDLVESGTLALEMVADGKYDMIILDYLMPELDGCKTYIEMKKKHKDIDGSKVIIMLTCENSNSHIANCKLSGIEHFIYKPVQQSILIKLVSDLFNGVPSLPELSSQVCPVKTEIGKKHLSVLLAEDSPDNRFLIKKFTESFPWDIEIAENGQEALDLYFKKKFDFILMDMQMPIMDGYEATRSIRAHEAVTMGSHTPIVALTAHALREEAQECLDAGCDIHISKPVRKKDLVSKIDELLMIMSPREGVPDLDTASLVEEIEESHGMVEPPDMKDEFPVALVPEDLEPLIAGYMQNRRCDVVNIRQLVHNGDFSEAQRLAHSMKGSGGGYGFDKITKLGAAMEIAAKALDGTEILSGINELELYLDTVRIEYVDEEQ